MFLILICFPIFLFFGFFIFTSSTIDRLIIRNREIDLSLKNAGLFVHEFYRKNKKLPQGVELFDYLRDNDAAIQNSVTLNDCAEPLPEEFEPMPSDSFYLGYWRGEWCEFYAGWNRQTTLKFDEDVYYPLNSKWLTYIIFGLSNAGLLCGIYLIRKK